jgi:hypothetical protein
MLRLNVAITKPVLHVTFTIWWLVIIGSLLSSCAPVSPLPTVSDAYDFPIKPGTPAWEAFNSHAEMLRACQIPMQTLQAMSTKGLVETVLNYPLYGDFLAFFDLQQGFESVTGNFNGLAALLNRPDAGREVLARYHTMNPAAIDPAWTLEQQGEYDAHFTYIEMLLAQNSILDKLTPEEWHDVLNEALTKIHAKRDHADLYGGFGQERTALLIGRVLRHAQFASFVQALQTDATLQSFIDTGSMVTDEGLREILSQAETLLSGK